MISEIRNTTSPLDKIWNFGALLNPDYQLNPAVVPILIKEQSRRKTNNEHPLTIGESLWASKLCSTLFDLLKDNPEAIPESVIWWASEYALKEKLDKFAGTKEFDTSDFDAELVQHPDMSYETYLKDIKKGGRNPFLIPDRVPSHFGIGILFPLPTNIDLAKRDKIRKARQKKREKEGDYDLDKKLHFEKDGE